MAKAAKKKPTKKRESHYEEKVTFDGTFEQMVALSVQPSKPKHMTKEEISNLIDKHSNTGVFTVSYKNGNPDQFGIFICYPSKTVFIRKKDMGEYQKSSDPVLEHIVNLDEIARLELQ